MVDHLHIFQQSENFRLGVELHTATDFAKIFGKLLFNCREVAALLGGKEVSFSRNKLILHLLAEWAYVLLRSICHHAF